MKISSGSLRGMGIIMPKNQITRPTLSRVREAVFNILMNDLSGLVFWDLFSGSGAIGLSALSLGARECIFVESEKQAISALNKNLVEAKKRFLSNGESPPISLLFSNELDKVWKRLLLRAPPDIVWADPPYVESLQWSLFLRKELSDFVQAGALLFMEMRAEDLEKAEKEKLLVDPQWELVKTRKYGACSLVLWRKL